MLCVGKGNYTGLKSNESKDGKQVYHSLILIDNEDKNVEVSVPQEKMPAVTAKVKTMKRFDDITFNFILRSGRSKEGQNYTRLIFDSFL